MIKCILNTRCNKSVSVILRTLTTWQRHCTAALLCAVQQSIDISCRQQSLVLWPMPGQPDGHHTVS